MEPQKDIKTISQNEQYEAEIQGSKRTKEKPIIPKNKIVIVGDVFVGKTSISSKFVYDNFSENLDSTVGAVFLPYQVELDDVILQLEIWDTAGQERFKAVSSLYFRGCKAGIIVYDITNQETFKAAKGWLKQLNDNASPSTILALVGNKTDLAEKRQVSQIDAEKYASEHCLLYFEVSAKTGEGITDLFFEICKKLAILAQNNPEHTTVLIAYLFILIALIQISNQLKTNKENQQQQAGWCCS